MGTERPTIGASQVWGLPPMAAIQKYLFLAKHQSFFPQLTQVNLIHFSLFLYSASCLLPCFFFSLVRVASPRLLDKECVGPGAASASAPSFLFS